MADIINLRTMRKRRLRDEERLKAEQNRALHGRSKAERTKDATEKALAGKRLDGHKREE